MPERYLDAWARLQCQRPAQIAEAVWRQAIDDAGRFLDQWGSMAAEFQWTAGELFDCPRDGKPGGLVWVQKGKCVGALGPEYTVLGNGERVFYRAPRHPAAWCSDSKAHRYGLSGLGMPRRPAVASLSAANGRTHAAPIFPCELVVELE